jgi:hypothetical protein
LVAEIRKAGFDAEYVREKGLMLAPLTANVVALFFDGLDKVLFRTRGSLGPAGRFIRKLTNPMLHLEYHLPVDFGYTLFLRAKKTNA